MMMMVKIILYFTFYVQKLVVNFLIFSQRNSIWNFSTLRVMGLEKIEVKFFLIGIIARSLKKDFEKTPSNFTSRSGFYIDDFYEKGPKTFFFINF
jgi:hypothetical protein